MREGTREARRAGSLRGVDVTQCDGEVVTRETAKLQWLQSVRMTGSGDDCAHFVHICKVADAYGVKPRVKVDEALGRHAISRDELGRHSALVLGACRT